MKAHLLILGLLAAAVLQVSSATFAAERAQAGKIRVLVVTGGHGFQAEPFFAIFDSIPDVTYSKTQYPAAADELKPELTKRYDVLVFYDMWSKPLTDQQKRDFVALLQKGIGVVALHHTLAAHRDWPEYAKIIGGRYVIRPTKIGGKELPKSSYFHGQDLRVRVADASHPITRGLTDFQIHDETYKDYYTAPSVHVLLTTDHPKSDPEIAWVHRYRNSRVFYLILGHDHLAYENPAYRRARYSLGGGPPRQSLRPLISRFPRYAPPRRSAVPGLSRVVLARTRPDTTRPSLPDAFPIRWSAFEEKKR
ncbi:MAG: ThuA domain-containing protein [Planctomycetes bacterium]|nr:ThuA domain-containing protein [Planctomycetota bacterium]